MAQKHVCHSQARRPFTLRVHAGQVYGNASAQAALERAKTKIAETCERHQEMVLQLFHAERMVLEWRAHGFMQAGAEGEEDPAAAPAAAPPAPAPAQQ